MKLQTKISLLILSISVIFFLLLFIIQKMEKEKTNEMLEERKIEKAESFKRTLESVEKTLDVFSKDYTQWDEMVEFVAGRDSVWAIENIEYPLATFKANVVWIYNTNLDLVYTVNNLESIQLKNIPLTKQQLNDLLTKNYFNHFVIQIENQLFEIRTAAVQPTNDLERKAVPKGFFFVGKVWSKDVIEEISIQTNSRISLHKVTEKVEPKNDDIYTVSVSEVFLDWQSNPFVKIVSVSDFSILKKSADVFNLQIILFLLFSVAVIITVGYFLLSSFGAPINLISKSLKEENPAILVSTSKEKSEFGKLAQLIIQFFNQKEQLIDESKQRKFVETSLSISEEKYKKIFDNVQDVFFQTDLNGVIVSVSPSIERYSEYKQSEVLGKNILDYYLDPTVRLKFLHELKTKGEVTDFEIYFVRKSGKILPCSVNAHFLQEDGRLVGIEGSLRDASERKKHEEQILKLSRVVEQSPISVIITDVDGKIEYVNQKFLESSGYLLKEIQNMNVDLLKSGLMSDSVYLDLWKTIKAGNEWKGELLNRRENGELYWENVFVAPIKNLDNVIINFVILKEDITDKKKIIEELKTAKEKAEEMNNLKSSFLANMSHELRTPMMGILGNAEIISISSEDEEIKDMASAIYQSGRRLINTLNLILDLSRIEANKDSLDIEKLEVVSTINAVVDHFIPAAKQKGLSLVYHCTEEHIFGYLDERLFREILNNLINNAIKFTNSGGINVSLEVEKEKMIIKVFDTGIGIPQQNLGLIFEEFRQVSEGYGRNFEGTGLGLTITKKFVEKLGGKISVKSVLDKGSEFTIEFPIIKEL